MRYVLDTNIVSDILRDPQGRIAQRIEAVGEDEVCTSVVVAAELRYGAAKRGSARLTSRVNKILGALHVLALEPPADVRYGQLRIDLERSGRVIGSNDLLIAAHALSLGFTLVTDNEREFRAVAGLSIENWLHESG